MNSMVLRGDSVLQFRLFGLVKKGTEGREIGTLGKSLRANADVAFSINNGESWNAEKTIVPECWKYLHFVGGVDEYRVAF